MPEGKTQAVRLFDVFVLGPFMVWASGRLDAPAGARAFLLLSGVATIVFNGLNFLRIARA